MLIGFLLDEKVDYTLVSVKYGARSGKIVSIALSIVKKNKIK